MHIPPSLIGLVVLANLAHAQQLVVPRNTVLSSPHVGTSYNSALVFRNGPSTLSQVYDTSHFTGAGVTGPIVITRLRFRAEDGEPNAGGQNFAGVTVSMSSSPLDYTVGNTTFAAWRGADLTTVFSGSFTVAAASGTAPNDWIIDIPLTTPFVYDPTLGADLNIEVDHPAPTVNPTLLVAQAAVNASTFLCRQLSATTQAAVTGTQSSIVPVCLIDFVGPGGTSTIVPARVESYGAACGAAAASFYQLFDGAQPFDLRGPARSLLMTRIGPDNYVITAGVTAPDLTQATGVANTGDDSITVHALPFTFTHPGGSTTTLNACTNGYVWLGTNAVADYTPTLLEFRNSTARFCICWHDWYGARNTTTNPLCGMYVVTDISGGVGNRVTYVTWREVGEYATTLAGQSVSTMQMALFENGNVEFRYGAMSGAFGESSAVTPAVPISAITGYSRGGTTVLLVQDPGSRDLSIEVPFVTAGPEGAVSALVLSLSARPIVATAVTFTASNVPAGSILGAVLLNLSPLAPGFSLPPLAPGCIQSIGIPASTFQLFIAPGASVTSVPLTLPSTALSSWMGFSVYAQFATLSGASVVQSSNALKLLLGLN